jgi:predicted ATP-grasp superfamily ATP-dependent carboligase
MDLSMGMSFSVDVDEDDQCQYTTDGLRCLRTTPLVSISMEYEPRPGSMRLFHVMA